MGQEYTLDLTATTRQQAEPVANTIDDDAVIKRLIRVTRTE